MLLIAIYWAHIHFFKVNVVFYAAILDGVIATVVSLLLLWIIRPLRVFSGFEQVLIAVVVINRLCLRDFCPDGY